HNSHFYTIFSGNRSFGQNLARQLEVLLNIPPYTLDESPEAKTILEKVMFIKAFGEANNDSAETSNNIFVIEKSKIKNSSWQIDKIYGFIMDGESMSPTIENGSKVIIDTSKTKIEDGKVYALSKNNEIFLRRVLRQPGSTSYIARCDNEKYGKIEFKTDGDIKVIGRVVYLLNQEL
ncbi:MAG TPA: S24/S26 family peptidase, partial [Aquella sp.]|nr:S24/S26 family peptidase [Aquella sp.]